MSYKTLYWKLSTFIIANCSFFFGGYSIPTAALCTTNFSAYGLGIYELKNVLLMLYALHGLVSFSIFFAVFLTEASSKDQSNFYTCSIYIFCLHIHTVHRCLVFQKIMKIANDLCLLDNLSDSLLFGKEKLMDRYQWALTLEKVCSKDSSFFVD